MTKKGVQIRLRRESNDYNCDVNNVADTNGIYNEGRVCRNGYTLLEGQSNELEKCVKGSASVNNCKQS